MADVDGEMTADSVKSVVVAAASSSKEVVEVAGEKKAQLDKLDEEHLAAALKNPEVLYCL